MTDPKNIQPDLTGAVWQGDGQIQIAFVDDKICMRSDPAGPVLTFTQAEWDAFILGARDGEFDLDNDGRLPPLV